MATFGPARLARMSHPGWRTVIGLVVVLGLGLGVRLQPWNDVFVAGRSGASFVGDSDAHYHVLRAERIARDDARVPWRDDRMNYPRGADILWPPLFDQGIASVARRVSGGQPTRAVVERVAALLPPVLGVATVAVVWAIGFLLFRRGPGLSAALLFALLPSHVEFSVVGRPDQHVSESLLQALVMLTFAAGWSGGRATVSRRLAAPALGVAITLSFWNWQGSALCLLLLSGFVAVWHVVDREGALARRVHGTLALGAAVGSGLLALTILLWGRPGAVRSMSLSGINGIQALLTAMVALFALGLLLAPRARRGQPTRSRLVVEVSLAAAIPIVAAWALLPAVREGVEQGLLALTASNPWYASIREFQPMLFGGQGIRHDLAAWVPRFAPMFVMPLAGWGLARTWRRRPERRAAVVFLAAWGAMLLVPTLLRLRFVLYLTIPAVLWSAVGLHQLADVAGRRFRGGRARAVIVVAGMIALLAPAVFYFSHGGLRRDPTQTEVIAALEWLRAQPIRDPGRPAVFSEWDWGHLIQYYADRPAVATPFGTDGGDGAMEDMAAFFLTRSPAEARRILEERRAGYLLIVDPLTHAAESAAWSPGGLRSPVTVDWDAIHGPKMAVTPEVDDLVAVRVYYDNGLSSRGLPTLGNYRLVYEGPPAQTRQVRLFEFVPGAALTVSGAEPGAEVRAGVGVRTNRGREAGWHVTAVAAPDGTAVLRVPFSTGENGTTVAGPYEVSCGQVRTTVAVPAAAIETGGRVVADCSGEPRSG